MDEFFETVAVFGVLGFVAWAAWKAMTANQVQTIDTRGQSTLEAVPFPLPETPPPTNANGIVGSLSDFFGGPYLGGSKASMFGFNPAAGVGVPVLASSQVSSQRVSGYTGELPEFDARTGQPL